MKRYEEILKLSYMLDDANIPYEFETLFGGFTIFIYGKNDKPLCDAIEHHHSFGNEFDTIEIMGGLTEEEEKEDSVLGYLTAEEVFKRFKYCYENDTSTYVEEEK